MTCFLAKWGYMENGEPMPPCEGRIVKAHLIPAHVIRRVCRYRHYSDAQTRACVWDHRVVVPACGGWGYGNGGHHWMLDSSMRLRLGREVIPAATEEYARELGLEWYLDRHYGPRPTCSS